MRRREPRFCLRRNSLHQHYSPLPKRFHTFQVNVWLWSTVEATNLWPRSCRTLETIAVQLFALLPRNTCLNLTTVRTPAAKRIVYFLEIREIDRKGGHSWACDNCCWRMCHETFLNLFRNATVCPGCTVIVACVIRVNGPSEVVCGGVTTSARKIRRCIGNPLLSFPGYVWSHKGHGNLQFQCLLIKRTGGATILSQGLCRRQSLSDIEMFGHQIASPS